MAGEQEKATPARLAVQKHPEKPARKSGQIGFCSIPTNEANGHLQTTKQPDHAGRGLLEKKVRDELAASVSRAKTADVDEAGKRRGSVHRAGHDVQEDGRPPRQGTDSTVFVVQRGADLQRS